MATTENTYTGNGSTTLYSFTFPYIEESDVYVSLDGSATTAYSYANATQIEFNTAPASGVAIRIYRQTSSAEQKANFFAGSAIRARDLNDNFTQTLYLAQESENLADTAKTQAATAEASAATANQNSTAAAASAATATQQATASAASAASALAASQQASTDAAAAQASATAAAASSATAASEASQAATDSASAISTANTASTTATTALNNSRQSNGQGGFDTAISIANNAASSAAQSATDSAAAVATANTSNTNSSNAVSTANTASTNASNAVTTANTASANATTALNNSRQSDGQGGFDSAITIANAATTTANTALTNSRQSDGQGGFNTAISVANSASATANAASAAVSAAAFYTPIAAIANLPSSPSNEDRVEVVNSTGVQSSSAVSGVPSGFVGSTGLTVRLQYNSSTTKWVWQQYFAADPENRYATNYLAVIKGDGTSSGQVGKITLNCSNNNHGVSIQSPAHSAGATYTLTLPVNTGSANQALTTDGSGVLSWANAGSPTIDGGNFTTGGSLVTTTQTIDGGSF